MTPISSRRRSLYLALAALVVVVGAPVLIIYAEGYRPSSLWSFSFRETGGVYVAAGLSGVAVSVDGEAKDQTTFLSRGVLVQNLVEGDYRVSAAKEGYRPAEKTLPVYPSIVTEWRPLLLPEPLPLRAVPELLLAVSPAGSAAKPSPAQKNPERAALLALFAPATSTKAKSATSTLVLADPDFAAALELAKLGDVARNATLRRAGSLAAWVDQGAVRFAWLGEADAAPQYLCSTQGCRLRQAVRLSDAARAIEIFPGRSDALVVTTDAGVYAVELDGRGGRAILPLLKGAGIEVRVSGGSLVFKQGKAISVLSL